MKQLFFTSCEAGKGLAGATGFQARAASAGLAGHLVQAAAAYVDYALPPGIEPANAPVRLALLSTPDAGRLLCHTAYAGKDPVTGDEGNSFSHVLLDVPVTMDAQQAILTWGSNLWRRADAGGGTDLPDALYLPVSSTLNDAALARMLAQPARIDLLQFLVSAVLANPTGRTVVAAPAEDVALCVYGVTRAVPLSLLRDFTFSTFEPNPLACNARLVGTCWGDVPDKDLPAASYREVGGAYNTYSDRKAETETAIPFVEFAVGALASGQTAALDEFHATWQRLGVQDPAMLDLVFRMARGTGTLSKEESHQALRHPTLSAWIVSRPDALGQFLDWALEDPDYATGTFPLAVGALRQKPEVLAKLAQTVEQRGLAALRQGDLVLTPNALEGLLPMVSPPRAAAVWGELLNANTDPGALSWEMRCYLLPRLIQLRPLQPSNRPDPILERWLRVPADQLAPVLSLDLPEPYQLAAALAAWRGEDEPSALLARTLGGHPRLLLAVLKDVAGQPDGEVRARALVDAVLAELPDYPWVEEFVRQGRALPVSLLERCLDRALQSERADSRSLVRGHGPALQELLTGVPSLDRLAARLLSQPGDELLGDPPVRDFLQGLTDLPGLSAEVRTRLHACLAVRAFLEKPNLDREALEPVARALALEPPLFPERARGRVLDAVTAELTARAASTGVQAELEAVLLNLGPQTPGGPPALLRELLRLQQHNKPFWKQANLLHPFVALTLGATRSPELAPQLTDLDAEAFALAAQMGKRGGARVIAAIDDRTADWPKTAQSQWRFLVKAVQPRGVRGLLRDVLLFVGGVVVTVLGVACLKLLNLL